MNVDRIEIKEHRPTFSPYVGNYTFYPGDGTTEDLVTLEDLEKLGNLCLAFVKKERERITGGAEHCKTCGSLTKQAAEKRTKELFDRNQTFFEAGHKAVQAAADKMGIKFT